MKNFIPSYPPNLCTCVRARARGSKKREREEDKKNVMCNMMRAIIEKEEGKVGDEGRVKKNSPLLLMHAHAKDNS